MCNPVLRSSVDSLPGPLRRMAGYHFGRWDATEVPTNTRSGKSLRPALAIYAATACGAASPEVAVPAAAAVELLHNSTLLRGEIMDVDHIQRGGATVRNTWGIAEAIVLGKALHALAIQVLAAGMPAATAVEAITWLETAAVELCRGQYSDCAFETRRWVDVDEYVQMAMGKTGALMGCACVLGALCGGANTATVSAMEKFGREIGLAFRFVNDLIGI